MERRHMLEGLKNAISRRFLAYINWPSAVARSTLAIRALRLVQGS